MNNGTKHEAQGLEVAQQIAPAGYVMVPVELLTDLRDSANDCYNNEATRYKDERRMAIYKEQVQKADELLAAAPNAECQPVSDERDTLRKQLDEARGVIKEQRYACTDLSEAMADAWLEKTK